MKRIHIDGETLTIEDTVAVARHNAKVAIPRKTENKVKSCRDFLERLVEEKRAIYGVTTGFGALGNITIPSRDMRELQSNLIRSHSAGVGKPLEKEIVRAMMLLRINTLAKGYSGVRMETLQTLVHMLNKGVHPIIPEKGSVGASGDLAPLSHMTLVMIGEGLAEYKGKVMSGRKAMGKAEIQPIKLDVKEGVALSNGTQLMTAIATLSFYDAEKLVKVAEVAAAMSLEALMGISDAFDERIHRVRPHRSQIKSAQRIRLLTAGSKLITSGEKATRLGMSPQDPYCLRCTPQVLGSVREAIDYVRNVVEIEINSATDNPLVFAEDEVCFSGGNFHGQPVALAMDILGVALATVGNLAERRIARLTDENLSQGLPAFLIPEKADAGIQSGFMAVQYTAAALASENKVLAHPASVDSIPTSANFEDFVSMGPTAARKAMEILHNVEYIVAIELLCAAQGAYIRGSEKLGKGTKAAYSLLRKKVPPLKKDKPMYEDIEATKNLIHSGDLLKALKTA
ncbi:MAG: histidine ammonia-lyase [Candidatus Bathyarchaeota archaeon]|jgi:histidine ammonia-lyase